MRLLVLSIAVLVLVLVLESIQYSNPVHWSATSRVPPRSTIGIAAFQTAIEYEYRFTEYRFAEYEYDEIRYEPEHIVCGIYRNPRDAQCFTNTAAPYGVFGFAGLKNQEMLGFHEPIEGILSSKILGSPMAHDDAAWLAKSPALREKLIAVGLVDPETIPERVIIPTLDAVDKLMKKANLVWQVILVLSRYPVFLNHRTHRTNGNKSSHRNVIFPCVRCVP